MLYSDDLPPYTGPIPAPVQECLQQIKVFFNLQELKILGEDDTHIAVPVTYSVSLPTRGPVNNIDIREQEPVLITIHLPTYPVAMPTLKSDRKDFPKNRLSHLYVSKTDHPAEFCLVRNDPDEWFANKRMADLLTVGGQWLFKAANGLLTEDADEFDPTRLEEYEGHHSYHYDALKIIVQEDERFEPTWPYALLLTTIENADGYISYQSSKKISREQSLQTTKTILENTARLEKLDIKFLYSLLVWRPDKEIEAQYDTVFPEDYAGLKAYFLKRNIDLPAIIKSFCDHGLHLRNGIPLIYAIRRPKKMVGHNGEFEFINFLIAGKGVQQGVVPDDAGVAYQQHTEPFSATMAQELSGDTRDTSTLFIGGGSLGSKIILHDARSGKTKIGIVDHDALLDHNMARHALLKHRVGANKATALVAEMTRMFKLDDTTGYKKFPTHFFNLEDKDLAGYEWLVDTTASVQVQNLLAKKIFPQPINICRCELVNDGKMGLLYIEGEQRNPRIDDLMALTNYQALQYPSIEEWRKSDAQRDIKNLNIGLGCSSPTTVMSDDAISFHASVFSRLLYQERKRVTFGNKGFLFRSIFDWHQNMTIRTEQNIVDPFEVYTCQQNSGWEIRLTAGLSKQLLQSCREKGKIETGGILIGLSNFKTKTIHVFQIISEPRGSSGTCTGFTRGNAGLPENVNHIKEKTGEVIGYVAEWHTHPMNLERLSEVDIETIQTLITINRQTPIPTCAVIVTNKKILPFVFE